jgi:bisphosphoglycerate-dependent phosphoglycerate mutase family 1
MTYTLILLRHGNSDWNQKNLFTGWVDVRLSDQGVDEAKRAGELLAASGLKPEILYTSVLTRAIQTANLALEVADRLWIPVKRTWRLNERHYGALQGLDKAETLEKFGQEKFMEWRRSFDVPPPVLDDDAEYSQVHDERYIGIDGEIPRTESLALVIDRMLPYWGERHHGRPEGGQDRAGHRSRQLAARPHQAPRPHQRRRHLRAQRAHGHPAGVRTRREPRADQARLLPRPRSRRRRCSRCREPGQEVALQVRRANDERRLAQAGRRSCVRLY